MSGGSLDYFYRKVEEVAEDLNSKSNTISQRAFANHLFLIAKALHDIEWVMSGDYSDGDDEEAINNVFKDIFSEKKVLVIKKDALKLIEELNKIK